MSKLKLMSSRICLLLFFASVIICACGRNERKAPLFELLSAAQTGIQHSNQLIEDENLNILTFEYFYNGAGVGAGDFNNDGLCDLFFCGNMNPCTLYFNEGKLKFKDVTQKAGIDTHNRWATGVSVVDINADGWLDIYVCCAGPYPPERRANLLYLNQGNGTFVERAAEYGLDDTGHTTQAAFFDLAAIPIKALMQRNPKVDWAKISDVIYGCANQAGEDNRNVARMAALLAGLPLEVPGVTLNRLCGSGLDAVGSAARAIKSGEVGLMIAGGVESMSRAPFVMPKAESAFSRSNAVYDTTIGWRFVNKLMKEAYGVDSMPETAENVAVDYKIEREAQDLMALRSQKNAMAAIQAGHFVREICPVVIPQKKGEPIVVSQDEHPRETTIESLTKLKGVVRPDGSVTAGNASGVNDGACALLLADDANATRYDLIPKVRVVGMATA